MALVNHKSIDPLESLKIFKALPIIKWTEAFDDVLNHAIGSRTIPLSQVTGEVVVPLAVMPPR